MKQMFQRKGIFKMILCLILVFSMVIPNVSMVAMADERGEVTTGGGIHLPLTETRLKLLRREMLRSSLSISRNSRIIINLNLFINSKASEKNME